jgi:fibronectin type 3 domain-containing protein
LNIPTKVTDLSAVEQGSKIIVQFSAPRRSTEGLVLKKAVRAELRVMNGGEKLFELPVDRPVVRYELPATEWIGKNVTLAVRVMGANARDAGWSNTVSLGVVAPLPTPDALTAQAVPTGVQLTWRGSGVRFRIFRRTQSEPELLTTTVQHEFIDTTSEYGKTYHYSVQALDKSESEVSPEFAITPADRFAPAVPAGLTAVISTASIELVWERNTEADLAGYRVYRAEDDAIYQLISGTQEAPNYSDRKIESGKRYRFSVTAIDQNGNESEKSPPVEVTVQ